MIFLSLLAKELFKVKVEVWETPVLVPALPQASSATLVKRFYTASITPDLHFQRGQA